MIAADLIEAVVVVDSIQATVVADSLHIKSIMSHIDRFMITGSIFSEFWADLRMFIAPKNYVIY